MADRVYEVGDRVQWRYPGQNRWIDGKIEGQYVMASADDSLDYLVRMDDLSSAIVNTVALRPASQPGPDTLKWAPKLNADDPFDAVVTEITDLNHRKRSDYADQADIFSNFKDAGRQLGLTPGHAVELHVATKQSRLRQLLGAGREPNNESVRDSLVDRAVYSLIAVALWDAGLYKRSEQ